MSEERLPHGWTKICFGQVCNIRNGYAFKSKDFQASGIPLIRQSNLTGQEVNLHKAVFLPASYADEHHGFLVRKGDILLGMSGSIGEPSIYKSNSPALQNQRTGLLRCANEIDVGFVRYFIDVSKTILIEKSKGMAVQNISAKDIEEIPVLLPPANEQRRIVDKIEQLFSNLDEGEALLKQVQEQLATYRQSVLKAAVTGELVGVKGKDWKKQKIENLITDIRYGTAKKCVVDPSKTPVLRIPNVAAGKIDLADLKHAIFSEDELDKLRLQKGDILIVRSNGSVSLVGRSAVVSENAEGCVYAGYLIRLRLKQETILPEFLNLFLDSPFVRNKIELQARSTSGVHNINSGEVKAIAVPVPKINLQQKIVDKVDEAFSQIDALEKWCESELARCATLRQSILKDAFSGKLVPQDPSDEPASELLKRIQVERAKEAKPPKQKSAGTSRSRGRRKKAGGT